jgi:hypothetical protein
VLIADQPPREAPKPRQDGEQFVAGAQIHRHGPNAYIMRR